MAGSPSSQDRRRATIISPAPGVSGAPGPSPRKPAGPSSITCANSCLTQGVTLSPAGRGRRGGGRLVQPRRSPVPFSSLCLTLWGGGGSTPGKRELTVPFERDPGEPLAAHSSQKCSRPLHRARPRRAELALRSGSPCAAERGLPPSCARHTPLFICM